jgi:splicing factor 45
VGRNLSFLPPLPPPPPAEVPDDIFCEDAFARRMRMSQQGAIGHAATANTPTPPPVPPAQATPAPSNARHDFARPCPLPTARSHLFPREPLLRVHAQPGVRRILLASRPGRLRKAADGEARVESRNGLGRDGTAITKAIQIVTTGKWGQPGRGKIMDKNKKRPDLAAQAASEVGNY